MKQMDQCILMCKSSMELMATLMPSQNLPQPTTNNCFQKEKEFLQQMLKHKKRNIRMISHCGRNLSQMNQFGIHHGVKVDLDGTLSALQWQVNFSKSSPLIFIPVVLISDSLIMTTRSLSQKHTTIATTGLTTSFTLVIFTLKVERWLNH